MGTYILSFVFFSLILSCFYKKKSYQNRFQIALYSALLSLIPVTIMNLRTNNKGERELITVKSIPLLERISLKDTLPGDTVPKITLIYFEPDSADKEIKFSLKDKEGFFEQNWREKDICDLIVKFIKPDSTNLPRYEVKAEKLKSSSKNLWISSLGIPNKNRKMYLYLPRDTNMIIFNKSFNGIKRANTN